MKQVMHDWYKKRSSAVWSFFNTASQLSCPDTTKLSQDNVCIFFPLLNYWTVIPLQAPDQTIG